MSVNEEWKVVGELTDLQFYRWRLPIEKLHHAKTRVRVAQLSTQLMQMEIALAQSRLANKKLEEESAAGRLKLAEADFKKVQHELEQELGINLENCGINEETLELTELPAPAKET